ncbi:TIGR01440 family protein [Pseudalkalibacillus decolorationis]|uniref:TIGR01440 family protein n=1 Tax=Pseudalkalibacillus decolorationis TaxID=163879 RepID=UPI0021496670|nr:TIGR01440 family protein [Pseudalkalibacillus decolorationis]
MDDSLQQIQNQVLQVLEDLDSAMPLSSNHLLVVGASTSEVLGEAIGTSGTMDVAHQIFEGIQQFQVKTEVCVAFQCCEHLNRALVMERDVALERGFEIVSVVPVRSAGGAMSTYVYHHMKNPVVVEFIKADAGIDIGDTFIGMHLKHVAVPVRSEVKSIGDAHVTLARTRPKLIGGERAVYPTKEEYTCT